jgi:hypothetical protein
MYAPVAMRFKALIFSYTSTASHLSEYRLSETKELREIFGFKIKEV